MISARTALKPWTSAALGAGGMLAIQNLGPIALSSGATAPACATLLIAAAAGILIHRRLPSRGATGAASGPPPFVEASAQVWALGAKPSEWLAQAGALAVPDDETEGFLRARLGASLNPMPPAREGRWEASLPEPLALLALAFAARAAAGNGVERPVGGNLLRGLSHAMGLPDGTSRDATLADLRTGLAARLGRGSAIERAYRAALAAHGTRETAFLGLLSEARRRSGVLAPAEFVWLKGVDRPLWYALNNLGRRKFHVEGLAAMAHHRAELAAGRPFAKPRVEDAIAPLADLCRDLRRDGAGAEKADGEAWR